jgi:hypothetical protein
MIPVPRKPGRLTDDVTDHNLKGMGLRYVNLLKSLSNKVNFFEVSLNFQYFVGPKEVSKSPKLQKTLSSQAVYIQPKTNLLDSLAAGMT